MESRPFKEALPLKMFMEEPHVAAIGGRQPPCIRLEESMMTPQMQPEGRQ
jgi:hypothetical protein